MSYNLWKKGLVFGIMLLFVGASVIPTVMSAEKQKLQAVTTMQNTWYVDDSGNNSNSGTSWGDAWRDVNYAIGNESVLDGDTIMVGDGTYYENVVVDKTIDLIGENRETTIIDGGDSGNVVYISADGVSISKFTMRNSGIGVDPPNIRSGIAVPSKEQYIIGISIIKNKIINNQYGINIAANKCIISGNIISNNLEDGINLAGISDTISRNTISDNKGGIIISLAWSNKIHNNNFINNSADNAFFFLSVLNLWLRNYWDRPRLLPYPIFGLLAIIPPIPWLNIDWRPALKPYDI